MLESNENTARKKKNVCNRKKNWGKNACKKILLVSKTKTICKKKNCFLEKKTGYKKKIYLYEKTTVFQGRFFF